MNDNRKQEAVWRQSSVQMELAQTRHLSELNDLAIRAVLKPDDLTMDEIQEVGWGYLMTAYKRAALE